MKNPDAHRSLLASLRRFNWTLAGKKACVFVVNVALLLAGLFNLALGCYAALEGNQAMTVTCLVAGLLLLLAASIDRFEVLKGFGLEAKTRLNEVLTEADATLENLRHLAVITSQSIIELSSSAGRWGGAPSVRQSNVRAQGVKANLLKLGADPATIREILHPWARIALHVATAPLIKSVRDALHEVEATNNALAMGLPTPHSSEDAVRYAALRDKAVGASDFNRDRVGEPWSWPAGTHAGKFAEILRTMPVVDEEVRSSLRARIEPWLPRLQHLETNQELLEVETWYALDANA
jgi:hypothetical protein